jgi:hypothetical protein
LVPTRPDEYLLISLKKAILHFSRPTMGYEFSLELDLAAIPLRI